MDAKWRIQPISKKIIKPSIPTPSHLKTYKLSLLDQLTLGSYIPIALFYPPNNPSIQISQTLEKSLSELLTSYYPFAGTLSQDGNSVECNDKGASFSEAVINCSMLEFIEENDTRVQDFVFSNKFAWGNMGCPEEYLLFVQLNHFECGGKALSFRISHKVADGCSLTNFFIDFAAVNTTLLQQDDVHSGDPFRPSIQLIGASLLPPANDQTSPSFSGNSHREVICKRYKFSGKSLAQLKALIAAEDHDLLSSPSDTKPPYITRVELVTALLFKCAVAATAKTRTPQPEGNTLLIKPSNLMQVADLRRMIIPQLASNVVGNLYTYMDIVIENEDQMKLSRLVNEGKKAKLELKGRVKQCYGGTLKNDLSKLVLENHKRMAVRFEKDVYLCSSFCGYPLYNIDFGFGLPIWSILGSIHDAERAFFLMDNLEGDGVEALVTLDKKVMSVFENEYEIRTFASTI